MYKKLDPAPYGAVKAYEFQPGEAVTIGVAVPPATRQAPIWVDLETEYTVVVLLIRGDTPVSSGTDTKRTPVGDTPVSSTGRTPVSGGGR